MALNQEVAYNFEWDVAKALSNANKHGVTFDQAATVFLDVLALTVFDAAHSQYEERWGSMPAAHCWQWRIRFRRRRQRVSACGLFQHGRRPNANDSFMRTNLDR